MGLFGIIALLFAGFCVALFAVSEFSAGYYFFPAVMALGLIILTAGSLYGKRY